MEDNNPTHLLSKLGVLVSFSIAKRISKDEILKITKKLNRVYKEKNPQKFQKLLTNALIESTKKYVESEIPPGLIFPPTNPKKEKLNKIYSELTVISESLSDSFKKQKFDKHQICFIINALINYLGLDEHDFEDFHRKFNKYKNDEFDDDDDDDTLTKF